MPKGSQVFHGSLEEALNGSGILASNLALPAGVNGGMRLLSRASPGPVHMPERSRGGAGAEGFSGAAWAPRWRAASEPGCGITRGLVFAGGAFCAEEVPGKASKAAVAIITVQNCNILLDRSPMWMLLPGNVCRSCKSLRPARYFFSKLL